MKKNGYIVCFLKCYGTDDIAERCYAYRGEGNNKIARIMLGELERFVIQHSHQGLPVTAWLEFNGQRLYQWSNQSYSSC